MEKCSISVTSNIVTTSTYGYEHLKCGQCCLRDFVILVLINLNLTSYMWLVSAIWSSECSLGAIEMCTVPETWDFVSMFLP